MIESEVGKGSCFKVDFPVKPVLLTEKDDVEDNSPLDDIVAAK